ncbi:MAG: heme d1 biosynthesis radical SAM protein NirJ [Ottowia sp.]|uniref:Pre-heme d1 synthase n=1 Tax=Ottowia beijingensis TaxID=1207057 RepID=A0A853IWU3_9BURK|nr:heme d1 biosynthesis radical SAM protein NirJ [Ottowia beijingensis]MBP7531699.1 heme d1 biosynthesis radical SAM protein NirJ [Ottowia sp.]MBP7536419.1 heme d1 biosynthesis radical SAM protein NirJ [Ottowia sp.]MBP9953958.1 heme d1 biosynthesis radical SAM protein NirJ [Ottowia sp.]NZA03014.1 heme d1 biosynthesis radical SAM protein NirJ [Ottowia beijingensis]HRL36236.1 heme d1 biosynthesis radical SAM protein NirJ [Ottowia beijingensis]
MFRISHFMHELAQAEATGAYPAPKRRGGEGGALRPHTGPVVIWNLIRRCNLTCKHCYAFSADHDYPGELSTQQVFDVMDDLHAFKVPALILSGGEPLLRPDIFEVAERAKQLKFYVGLSTNGTLIDEPLARRIHDHGFDYVGISLDGIGATHDKFRRLEGAFDRSLAAVRHLQKLGTKVGLRFTMTELNAFDLPKLLQLMKDEGVDKFYFSHLNYAGRGNIHRGKDARHLATRQALDLLYETAWADAQAGGNHEYVTGNNDADGVYLLQWVEQRLPRWADDVRQRLTAWGGNSSGVNIANIDNVGDVHPDTMWWHYSLGNVKARPFSDIWHDTSDPLMAGLKARPRPVTGRCGACQYFAICGGNTRVRAQQVTGDAWAEDPGCYLTDEEIGVESSDERVETTAFSSKRRVIELVPTDS